MIEILAIIGPCTVLGLPLLKRLHQQYRFASSGEYRLDQMNERQFEEYLERMMQQLGYHVEHPRSMIEDRASQSKMASSSPALIISTNGLKISVHANNDGKPVDSDAIQAAITAQQRYGCSDTMIISSTDFSAQAHTLAYRANVILWTKNDMKKAALSIQRQSLHGLRRDYRNE